MEHLDTVWNDFNTWSTGLKTFAFVVAFFGLILFVVTLLWFIIWIKYSWFHRTNSANLTGGQLSKLYLERYGVNAKRIKFKGTGEGVINHVIVEPKIFYLRPYLVNQGTLTLRLAPWTCHRSSIYTLAMAMQSSWAISSSKSSRFNSFWWDFSRKILLIFILLPFILAALFIFTPATIGFVDGNYDTVAIVFSILGSLFLIFYSSSQLFFYSKSRKEIAENLRGILLPNEIRAISFIFQIKFIYFLIRTIYEILRLVFEIIIASRGR